MAENAQGSSYTEGMKWVIAFSVAAVAGGFTHLSDLSKLSDNVKGLGAASAVAFIVAAYCGIQYMVHLWTSEERKRLIEEIQAGGACTKEEEKEIEKLRERIDTSKKSRVVLYGGQAIASLVAVVLTAIFLPMAILGFHDDAKPPTPCCTACPPPQPVADRYSVVLSAVHPGSRGGVMQHTFLLDKQTGRIWQMVCQKGGLVAFHEVPRTPAP